MVLALGERGRPRKGLELREGKRTSPRSVGAEELGIRSRQRSWKDGRQRLGNGVLDTCIYGRGLLLVMTRSGIGPVDQEGSGANSPGREEGAL